MGHYTVLAPCVVGDLHYARIPAEPIEVDDAVAAPLVAIGALAPVNADPEKPADQPPHRRRSAKEG